MSETIQFRRSSIVDALTILSVGASIWFVNLFVEPHYGEFTFAELTYSSFYNTLIGCLVGFGLFDRLHRDGLIAFASKAVAVILAGTLINEIIVEPMIFDDGPINREGVYHGVLDALVMTSVFLLIRVVGRLNFLQARAASALQLFTGRMPEPDSFLVKVATETRRVFVQDVMYLAAERDFTRIVCSEGEHFASESLKNLVAKTEPFGIARIHKSYAINMRRVDRIAPGEARIGDALIPVGRQYWKSFVSRWAGAAKTEGD